MLRLGSRTGAGDHVPGGEVGAPLRGDVLEPRRDLLSILIGTTALMAAATAIASPQFETSFGVNYSTHDPGSSTGLRTLITWTDPGEPNGGLSLRIGPQSREVGGQRRTYLTTPSKCPAGGEWTIRGRFTYADASTQNLKSTSSCA